MPGSTTEKNLLKKVTNDSIDGQIHAEENDPSSTQLLNYCSDMYRQ